MPAAVKSQFRAWRPFRPLGAMGFAILLTSETLGAACAAPGENLASRCPQCRFPVADALVPWIDAPAVAGPPSNQTIDEFSSASANEGSEHGPDSDAAVSVPDAVVEDAEAEGTESESLVDLPPDPEVEPAGSPDGSPPSAEAILSPEAAAPPAPAVGDPDDCSSSPIVCGDQDLPLVNGVPVEPPGEGGCPAGMTKIEAFCIDRWEAALVVVEADGGLAAYSPFHGPGKEMVRAVSAPGLVPQGYVTQVEASAACEAAQKRLCTDSEWLRACRGPSETTYPYGSTFAAGLCNVTRVCHPVVQYFESTASWIWSELDHPCLNQLPEGLALTGAYAACVTAEGLYDMHGNLHEWTSDPNGTFRGGFYVDGKINGAGCLYKTTAHNIWHADYSTGFRCCADP